MFIEKKSIYINRVIPIRKYEVAYFWNGRAYVYVKNIYYLFYLFISNVNNSSVDPW